MSQTALAGVKFLNAVTVRSGFPVKLTIGLTYRCQSKCNCCSIWKRYQDNPSRVIDEVHGGLILKTLEYLRNSLIWIEFTGGEPFLRDDVTEIIGFAAAGTGVTTIGITSNGLNPKLVLEKTREILSKVKRKRLVVGVSIDGDRETYRKSRGLDGFDSAIETFLELKRLSALVPNLRPHAAYTINRFNAGAFAQFYGMMQQEYGAGLSDFSFAIEHPFGYYYHEEPSCRETNADEFRKRTLNDVKFILNIRRSQRLTYTNPVNLFYDYYLMKVQTYLGNPRRQIIPCKACEYSAYIDPYGDVYPCTMWKKAIGSLKKSSFKSIWNSGAKRLAQRAIRAGDCPNCWTPCEAQHSWIMNFGPIRGWW